MAERILTFPNGDFMKQEKEKCYSLLTVFLLFMSINCYVLNPIIYSANTIFDSYRLCIS